MQLPNWAKIIWWLLLVGVLSFFLHERLPDLLSGKTAATDIAVFGGWMALLLAPLFCEVTLLGVTLKNEIEKLKGQPLGPAEGHAGFRRCAFSLRHAVPS